MNHFFVLKLHNRVFLVEFILKSVIYQKHTILNEKNLKPLLMFCCKTAQGNKIDFILILVAVGACRTFFRTK